RTGDTRIEEGTLKLEANNSLADESHIEILSGASLHLDFVGGDTVSSITFGNDFITDPGTYNAASHPNFISGGGALVIPASDPFADWIADFTFPPGADLSKSGDADEDGQSNLLEFALDGDPSN